MCQQNVLNAFMRSIFHAVIYDRRIKSTRTLHRTNNKTVSAVEYANARGEHRYNLQIFTRARLMLMDPGKTSIAIVRVLKSSFFVCRSCRVCLRVQTAPGGTRDVVMRANV